MKQSIKLIISAVVLAAVIALAAFGYNYLKDNYTAPEQTTASDDTQSTVTTEKPRTQAADFTVYTANGDSVKLSDFKGKPVVINFWASWCSPCTSELPYFNNAYKKYGEDIVFLMVNMTDSHRETIQSVSEFITKNSYSFPVYFDTYHSGSNAYNVSSIPFSVFVDKDGNVYKTHLGSMNEQTLTGYITKLL